MRAAGLLLLLAVLAPGPSAAAKKGKSSAPAKSAKRYGVLATGPSAAPAGKAAVGANRTAAGTPECDRCGKVRC